MSSELAKAQAAADAAFERYERQVQRTQEVQAAHDAERRRRIELQDRVTAAERRAKDAERRIEVAVQEATRQRHRGDTLHRKHEQLLLGHQSCAAARQAVEQKLTDLQRRHSTLRAQLLADNPSAESAAEVPVVEG